MRCFFGKHGSGIDIDTSQPSYSATRQVQGSRLAFYILKADAKYWDEYWQQQISSRIYEKAERGYLGPYQQLFTQYLPRHGRILEAGCGLGQIVLALRQLGYDAEGVDWGEKTVQAVRSLYPNLPIHVSDVTQLDVPDGYYTAYISLGVVEHRQEGPQPFLLEAYRVLVPGGVILISVPHFHILRRLNTFLGYRLGKTTGLEFYQYAFTPKEFLNIIQGAGFKILETFPFSQLQGIATESALIRFLLSSRLLGYRLAHLINASDFIRRHMGHMFLVVGQKSDQSQSNRATV
jgi:SAM-dependent methyltransferase